MSLNYAYTNESLDAIIRGMDAQKGDDIIAICGAGDQAYALLEYANSVVAVDCDARQIAYAMKRAEALKAGNYEAFFPENQTSSTHIYERDRERAEKYFTRSAIFEKIFRKKQRLERIRGKLDNLEFKTANIHDFARDMQSRKYSKAYLSNALTFSRLMQGCLWGFVEHLAAKLRNPGIIYLADGSDACLKHMYNLEEDRKLTEIAMEAERKGKGCVWRPAVFRRRQ